MIAANQPDNNNSSKSIKPNSVKKSRSSNLTENAGFPVAPIKGNYRLRERAITKRRIYDMILAGKSYVSIMEELGISERTFYRYLDVIFAQERDFIKETIPAEEIGRQLIILRDRFLQQKQEIDEWLTKDPNAHDRTELADLRASLCTAIYHTYEQGTIMLSSRHQQQQQQQQEQEQRPKLSVDIQRRYPGGVWTFNEQTREYEYRVVDEGVWALNKQNNQWEYKVYEEEEDK